jgi:hypothetical protein
LNLVGAPINQANTLLLEFWAQTENGANGWENVVPGTGTYAAPGTGANIYNPFNVIAPPGVAETGTQGDIQVYPSWAQGIAASADLIKQSSFAPLLAAMKQGAPLSTLYNSINWNTAVGTGTNEDYMPALTAYLTQGGSGPIGQVTQGATSNYTPAVPASATDSSTPLAGSNASGGGCGAASPVISPAKIAGVTVFPGLSACNAKALKGGALTALGGTIALLGVALIVVSGFAGKGPAAPVVSAATGFIAGARKIPGVGRSTPSTPSGPSEASVTRSDSATIRRESAKRETSIPSEVNYSGGRPRRSEMRDKSSESF